MLAFTFNASAQTIGDYIDVVYLKDNFEAYLYFLYRNKDTKKLEKILSKKGVFLTFKFYKWFEVQRYKKLTFGE